MRQCLFDGLASDENLAHGAHRLAQRAARQWRNNRPDQRSCRKRAFELLRHIGQQASRRTQQRKGRANQQRPPLLLFRTANGAKPLCDELIRSRRICGTQQCLRKTHQRPALHTVERGLLEHGLEK